MTGTKTSPLNTLNTLNIIDFVGSTSLTVLGAAMVFATIFVGFGGFSA